MRAARRILERALGLLASLRRGERGAVAVTTAILLPVLLGSIGIGFETAGWYQTQRALQNAADSAAVAAATNDTSGYNAEAQAVAAQFGFTNGVGGVVVTATPGVTCPAGGSTCDSVTITKPVPLYLIQLLGFQGNTTLNGDFAEQFSATAIAQQGTAPRNFCILALASSGAQGITTNGAPSADLHGCNIMSDTSADCHGHNLDAGHGDAHTTASGCGTVQDDSVPIVPDPYSYLAADIPANTCSSYPQESAGALPASNKLSGSITWGATETLCGDVQLTGNVSLTTASPGTVLVIENGQLDTNGHTLQTLAGSGLTIIFTGNNGAGYTYAPTGGGTLDIAAPTSGTWSGVVLYQDPSLTNGVNISAAGNSPTWDITGVVYLPHSSVTFSGAVNKATNGYSCMAFIVDNMTINGNGSILDEGQCAQAGVTQPAVQLAGRGTLVG